MIFGTIIRTAALAAIAAAPLAVHAEAADPAARLASYNDGVVAIMKAGLPMPARVARFDALVGRYYDMAAIAALVVGPTWATTPPADRQAAIAALRTHSATALARNFVAFGGEIFRVDPNVSSRGTSRIVKVTIASKGGSDTLLYRLREVGGEWRIIDVVSSGVSQLAVQRADLAGTVAQSGVPGMVRRLAAQNAAPTAAKAGS